MGVAVGAIALRLAALLNRHTGGTPTITDFRLAFVLVSVLAFLAVFDCFSLDPEAGQVVSGHRLSYQGVAQKAPE